MTQRLEASFYLEDDVVQISKELLGKFLVTEIDGVYTSGMIVETEAYRAPDDKACHAYNNRRTARTEVMFGKGGLAYVYLCYGIHHLFNVVTAQEDVAKAVLIRAIEPVDNIEAMLARRNFSKTRPQLTAGPGVMSKALGITRHFTGLDMTAADSPIWLEDRAVQVASSEIVASPRVGVGYAEECALWDWRFRIRDNPWTSPAK